MHPIQQVAADTRTPGSPPDASTWAAMSDQERSAYAQQYLTPEEWEKAQFNIQRAMLQLIVFFPFFGFMVGQMASQRVWVRDRSSEFRTMATDGKRLYIWPQFALYHDTKQLMAVLLHELFHNVLFHPVRGMGYHPVLRNLAMDYAINLMVNDAALEAAHLDSRGTQMGPDLYERLHWYIPVEQIGDGDDAFQFCYDERFRSDNGEPMQWEEIYQILLAELPPEQQVAIGRGDTPDGLGKLSRQLVDDHGPWRKGQRPADDEGTVNDADFSPEQVKRWAMDANAKCDDKMRGSMPVGMKRQIDEWLHPPLPWYRLLSSYMRLAPGEFSWAPGDTRFPQPMPWISEVPQLTYATFGFDTSGSMSHNEIAASVENARCILRGFPGMKGRAYFWDACVHDKMDLEDFDGQIKDGVHGGGGTSIKPQFVTIKEEAIEQDVAVHVCFTDGYVDWDAVDPDELPYDVLWVITNDQVQPPAHAKYKWTRLTIRT